MTTQTRLLMCAAGFECLAGLAFIVLPSISIEVLFRLEPYQPGPLIGRLAGVALLSLGAACWGATMDEGGPARAGTVIAITFYNAGAGLVLITAAAAGNATGVVIWIASILHLGLALAFGVSTPGIAAFPGPRPRRVP